MAANDGRTPGIGLAAGLLGAVVGIAVGSQYQPLPQGWTKMNPRAKRIALARTVGIGSLFGGLCAVVGYNLTGCECCTSAGTGTGTPLQVPVTPPVPISPPAAAPPVTGSADGSIR